MKTTSTDSIEQRCKHSTRSLLIWTLGWLLSLALVAVGPDYLWNFNTLLTLGSIAINLIFGYRMIVANKRYLDGLDELQRKLHMNAMAISLGVSVVAGGIYGLLEPIKLLSTTPSPANILVIMALSYLASLLINTRKYQ